MERVVYPPSEMSGESEPSLEPSRSSVLWAFSRPHTIVGSTLSVIGLGVVAFAEHGFRPIGLGYMMLALIWVLAGNVYIVGLNQIRDVEVDRVNKPMLPLASGNLRVQTAHRLVGLAAAVSLGLSVLVAPFSVFLLLVLALAIGTAYSVPPLHLKRSPFWAALCISTVRAWIVNLGGYLYYAHALGAPGLIPTNVWALAIFVFAFTLVIAWLKDIPDADGDRAFGVRTLTVRLGARRVFDLGRGFLTLAYGAMILAGIIGLPGTSSVVLVGSHAALLLLVWWRSIGVVPEDQASMTSFYRFIWNLFAAEYVAFPAACLLA